MKQKNMLCHRSGSIFSKVCFCHRQAREWATEDYIKNFDLGKVTKDQLISKGHFVFFNSPQKRTKIFALSAPVG